MSNDKEITVRIVPEHDVRGDANVSPGLGENGSVHSVFVDGEEGSSLVRFFTDHNEELPNKYFELLVENAEANLVGLDGDDKIAMVARIEEIAKQLKS